ncbi:hypothetical protein HYC85_029275 [Camellia sinensis]|uniref:Bacterial Ig-like domain-containing protein n=1 Tax=Camellia sinensis TaxID=4442 RepID=A0A7J7G1G5_CAMSI|nr:hypothetical protein HYC85_029275 [Camellia sinensis]
MGFGKAAWLVLHCWVFVVLCMKVHCDTSSEVSVKFLKTPHAFSNLNSATFAFQVLLGPNGHNNICTNCNTNCTLDDGKPSNCDTREVSYTELQDGNHTFKVCTNGPQGVGCAIHNWTVDTIPPTAYVMATTSFTNTRNVTMNHVLVEVVLDVRPQIPAIHTVALPREVCKVKNELKNNGQMPFSFQLLVYGAGQVVPTTLNILEPNLKFSLIVSLSSSVEYGRVILVMDKNFCTDNAGNKFTRTENSNRRSVFVNLRTHIPERLLQHNNETRTVQATNNHKNLKVYLYFSVPVLNSSAEILNSLHTSQGSLLPISGNRLRNRRFGFMVEEIPSTCIVTISLNSGLIISRQGTRVSPVVPVTFLYDSQRPAVRLSTTSSTRTKENNISVLIKFMKPVFGFNSSHISIRGGHLQSFCEVSRSLYVLETQADDHTILISIPENVTQDVSGNKNVASNVLQVRHYSVPVISTVLSTFATVSFAVTASAAGVLTLSTAGLQSVGSFSAPSSSLTSDPARNLFRSACHIQVFALSRYLADTLPVQYYEFARGLQWSIPYFSLPWETGHIRSDMVGSSCPTNSHSYNSKIHELETFENVQLRERNSYMAASIYGSPLTPMEYRSLLEDIEPVAEYILDLHNSNGWRDFNQNIFWLVVIGGSLILLHGLLLFILKLRNNNSEEQGSYGALIFPRFEIFLIILALPCICEASTALIKGGASSGVIVGILLLVIASSLLLALFLFLSIGITYGKLLQYKEIHQESRKYRWYRDIVKVTLGPGKKGQWTWKNQPNSVWLTMLGPLFEDLRGPPKYMLSQIARGNPPHKRGDKIIASDDETEDAEAPCVQKLFGMLRIYYTLLESMKRVCLGIIAGVLKKPFIKKKVQLVEIISVCSELGIFATCFLLLEMEFSAGDEMKIGIFMLSLFLVAFLTQIINEWYALYRQTKRLDPAEDSFVLGLKTASLGFFLFFIPQKLIKKLQSWFLLDQRVDCESVDMRRSSGSRRGSGMTDKSWLKQLRELSKSSFHKDGNRASSDPSSSHTRWSGIWSSNKSGNS